MPRETPKFKPGQHPISASDLNEISKQASEARRIKGAGDAHVGDSGGEPRVTSRGRRGARRFVLTESLAVDGSAAANLRQWDPESEALVTNTDVTFDVYDGCSMFNGESGTYGVCEYMEDAQRWEVVNMQCP